MSNIQPDNPVSGSEHHAVQSSIVTLIVIALLFSFGVTMLLFSMAYARDVQTILRAPELIWDFICGRPDPGGPVLPLMLTVGTLALLGGVVVTGWTRLRRRS